MFTVREVNPSTIGRPGGSGTSKHAIHKLLFSLRLAAEQESNSLSSRKQWPYNESCFEQLLQLRESRFLLRTREVFLALWTVAFFYNILPKIHLPKTTRRTTASASGLLLKRHV